MNINFQSPERIIINNLAIVMQEFNLNYEELLNLPIPTYNEMLKELERQQKEQRKKNG